MEDRRKKKFTYRYDEDTEKLLNEGLQKFNPSSLNKLIDNLIHNALINHPNEVNSLKNEVKKLREQLNSAIEEKSKVESKLNQLKICIKQDFENRERIKQLIS